MVFRRHPDPAVPPGSTGSREWHNIAFMFPNPEALGHRVPDLIRANAAATRTALLRIRRRPWTTLAIVVALGVGIGAAAAMAATVGEVFERRLPFPKPASLVTVRNLTALFFDRATWAPKPAGERLFSSFAAYRYLDATLDSGGKPRPLRLVAVTPSFFTVLALPAQAGRLLENGDVAGSEPESVVLSDALWRGSFGAERSVIGSVVYMGGQPYQIVGVAPRSMEFPPDAAAWVPMQNPSESGVRGAFSAPLEMPVVGRLKDSISPANAEKIVAGLVSGHDRYSATRPYVRGLKGQIFGPARSLAQLWVGVGLLLLALGVVTAACITHARSAGLGAEESIRALLGASPARLRLETAFDRALTALAAVALGELVAAWSASAVAAATTTSLHAPLGWGLACGAIATVAWAMASGGRTRRPLEMQLGQACVIALAITALIALQSVSLMAHADPGVDAGNTLVLAVSLPQGWGEFQLHHSRWIAEPGGFVRQLGAFRASEARTFEGIARRLRRVNGVLSVGVISVPPLSGSLPVVMNMPYRDAAYPDPAKALPGVVQRSLDAGAVPAFGLRLIAGQNLPVGPGGRVAMVNRSLAARFGGASQALGRVIGYPGQPPLRIVGVIQDVRDDSLEAPPIPTIYLPLESRPTSSMALAVRVRGGLPLQPFRQIVQAAVRDLAPGAAISHESSLEEMIAASTTRLRLASRLLAAFAILSLLLSAFSWANWTVLEFRTRRGEIGIRRALGCGTLALAALVAKRHARTALPSLVGGWVAAFVLAGVAAAVLPGFRRHDLSAYVLGSGAMVATWAAAFLGPFAAAARVAPLDWLREG